MRDKQTVQRLPLTDLLAIADSKEVKLLTRIMLNYVEDDQKSDIGFKTQDTKE